MCCVGVWARVQEKARKEAEEKEKARKVAEVSAGIGSESGLGGSGFERGQDPRLDD